MVIEPLIPPAKRGGERRVDLRAVAGGIMYILSTGCQWRSIPKDLPPRSTLHNYFSLWGWDFLRLATEETLTYLQWLNRFAEAEGLTEDAEQGD